MLNENLNNTITEYFKDRGVRKITIFGSYARGDQVESSDIDIIIEPARPFSLLDLVRMERELSERLGEKVDLLTEKSISPLMMDAIEKDKVIMYDLSR